MILNSNKCRCCKGRFLTKDKTEIFCEQCKQKTQKFSFDLPYFDESRLFTNHEFPQSNCNVCRGTGRDLKYNKPCWKCLKK